MSECVFCQKAVDPDHHMTYRRVVAWERKAQGTSRRSGSDIVLRKPRDIFACDVCIQRKRAGVAPLQGELGDAA